MGTYGNGLCAVSEIWNSDSSARDLVDCDDDDDNEDILLILMADSIPGDQARATAVVMMQECMDLMVSFAKFSLPRYSFSQRSRGRGRGGRRASPLSQFLSDMNHAEKPKQTTSTGLGKLIHEITLHFPGAVTSAEIQNDAGLFTSRLPISSQPQLHTSSFSAAAAAGATRYEQVSIPIQTRAIIFQTLTAVGEAIWVHCHGHGSIKASTSSPLSSLTYIGGCLLSNGRMCPSELPVVNQQMIHILCRVHRLAHVDTRQQQQQHILAAGSIARHWSIFQEDGRISPQLFPPREDDTHVNHGNGVGATQVHHYEVYPVVAIQHPTSERYFAIIVTDATEALVAIISVTTADASSSSSSSTSDFPMPLGLLDTVRRSALHFFSKLRRQRILPLPH